MPGSQTADLTPMRPATWIGAVKLVDIKKGARRGAWYVAEYRLRNMGKWWQAIVAFGLGNPILYLLSVGLGVGALVNRSSGGIDGVNYLEFLAPALLATACIQAAMDETSFPVFDGFTWTKFHYAMAATSLSSSHITGGIMIAALVRCVSTSVMYGAVLVLFGAINVAHVPALMLTSIFAGMGFGSVMMAITSFIKDDDGLFALIGRFIIAPMFMFSGTFYPLESMPWFLQWIGWVSPLWHATDLGRNLSYGHAVSGWLIAVHFVFLASLYATGLSLAAKQFKKRLSE